MAVTIYLVRHGQTEDNVRGILQGQTPGVLTEAGIEQARQLRDKLKDEPLDAVITSDLQRAVHTAQILNEPHGLPLELEPLLRERDWGIHTGMYIRDVAGRDIDPSAESVADMYHRAEEWLQKLLREHDGQTVLAVGHGLFHRVIQGAYLCKPTREVPRMENAEVRWMHITPPINLQYDGSVMEASEN